TIRRPSSGSTLFPYTTLFRSLSSKVPAAPAGVLSRSKGLQAGSDHVSNPTTMGTRLVRRGVAGRRRLRRKIRRRRQPRRNGGRRSEEHTSELQSRSDLVCRLL